MCHKKIQTISILSLLLGIVFSVSCMDVSNKQISQRLVRRNSMSVNFLHDEKVVTKSQLKVKQLEQENSSLKNKNNEVLSKVSQLESDVQQFKKEREQLEKYLIDAVSMIQDEKFKNAVWRQEVGAIFQERQRLLRELRLSHECYQKIEKKIISIENESSDQLVRFSEIYLENEKLTKINGWIFQKVPKFLELIVREILIRDIVIEKLKAMIIGAAKKIGKKNEEVNHLKQKLTNDAQDYKQQQNQLVTERTEILKKKHEEINNNNRTIWQQQIAICSLSALVLLLILDSCYDLKSFFVHA